MAKPLLCVLCDEPINNPRYAKLVKKTSYVCEYCRMPPNKYFDYNGVD